MLPCFGVAGCSCDPVHGELQSWITFPPCLIAWLCAGENSLPAVSVSYFPLEAPIATLCFKSMSPFETLPKRLTAFPTCSDLVSPCMTAF